jgi:hypothetical protein
MKYNCNKCNKEFSQISHYKKHLERKFPCDKNIIYFKDLNQSTIPKLQNPAILTPEKIILTPEKIILTPENIIETNLDNDKTLKIIRCDYCNKVFARKDNLTRHLKNRCLKKNNKELEEEKLNEIIVNNKKLNEIIENNKKLNEIIEDNKKLKEEVKKLKEDQLKILKKVKSTKKITNNVNNVNNGIVNNNIIVKLGKEELLEIFSKKEQISILKKGYSCLEYLIEYTHFNDKYPQFKNILITNLQNDIGYQLNPDTKNFDVINKDELLDDVIDYRIHDISEFYKNYKDDVNVREDKINDFLEQMKNERYKKKKEKKIKMIMYNNKNKIKRYKIDDNNLNNELLEI